MTCPSPSFDEAWAGVQGRLRRVLRARKVAADDQDDLLQEVAARALASRVPFTGTEDLLPWAATVLRRLHVDDLRRQRRTAVAAAVLADLPSGHDVERAALARLDAAAVAAVARSWPAATRALLVTDPNWTGRRTNAEYVRRHRLRARLRTVLDDQPAA